MYLDLLVIKTKSPELLKQQYELLGLQFSCHQHGKGALHYATAINDLVFEIYPLPKSTHQVDNTTRLGFQVEGLNTIVDRLAKNSWEIISNPRRTEWGYTAILQDRDGRKVELKEMASLA